MGDDNCVGGIGDVIRLVNSQSAVFSTLAANTVWCPSEKLVRAPANVCVRALNPMLSSQGDCGDRAVRTVVGAHTHIS